jgi:ketosteroid isomerase-like protein
LADDHVRVGVEAAMKAFLDAFNNFDVDAFPALFDNDVSAFAPGLVFSSRRDTLVDVMEMFLGRPWTEQRAKMSGPPYLNITPVNTRIQMIGESAAVVTFHLNAKTTASLPPLGRRTFVLRRDEHGRWLIVHVHASSFAE